ncbi:MAG: Ig-like domain-containing protein [Cyanobacteria bacterium J06621_11]
MRHLIQRRWRRLGFGVLGVIIALSFAACNPFNQADTDTPQPDSSLPPLKPFPEVALLETPALPDWIEQISPTEQADALAQVRIRFESPLIPLESLESSERQAVLDKFELVPELPGEFRFLTPRMVGFQGDRALPKATRYQVTLKAGLSDLENHQLGQDLTWTFNTDPIELSSLPGYASEATQVIASTELAPSLEFMANTALELDSIEKHVQLKQTGSNQAISVIATLVEDAEESTQPEQSPAEQFNPEIQPKRYSLTPTRSLKKKTDYTLNFTSGLRPAQGNLVSEEEYNRQFSTYAPLAFEKISSIGGKGQGGAYGRFENGIGILNFNNGLVAESALEEITIEPAPKESPQWLRTYNEDRTATLNPWALEPATEYTFTLGVGLTDIYGQTLGEPVEVTYKTGDLSPELWAPSGLNIFPTNQNLQLNVSTVNLPENYKAMFAPVDPTDLVYTDSAYPRERGNLLPDLSKWQSLTVKNERNIVEENAIPLTEKLSRKTGMLAYGVQAKTVQSDEGQWQEPAYYGLVQLTNLGVFAQWFPESGVVRVHHLSDGSAAIADIDIYKSQLDSSTVGNPMPCATGTTDKDGFLRLNAAALKQCMSGASQFVEPPELLAIARENEDWAFVRTQPYSGSYGFGIYADWEDDKPQSRGTVFSDRKLYQPGEKAWFTGVADYLENGALKQDKQVSYTVTLENPDGEKIDLGEQTTNDFGTFSVAWDVGEQQPLGNYVISAKSDRGVEIRGEFRVAEFNPPNFKVDLELDETIVEANQTVEAKAQSNYLFGPPVQDADVAYYVTRTSTNFVPEGWDKFTFGRRWDWPEERPEISPDVLQTTELLSVEGTNELSIEVDADVPYPMSYRVDAEVSDVSNLAVSSSQTFTALPSDRLIGLQADFVATAEEAFPVQVIVSGVNGDAIANQRVKLELQKATYSRVIEVIEGSRIPVDQIEYETVSDTTVRSGKTAKTVELTPPESGSYRIRANFTNADSPVAATDLRVWATGGTPVYWGDRYNNNRLSVQLDKDSYEVGETATALIQSPYPEADLFFSVIRHDTLYQTLQKVEGGAPQIQFTVTPEMLPNAAVEAVLIRKGDALEDLENPADLENLSSIGFAPFETSLENKYLDVEISPEQPTLEPGVQETLALSLKDAGGQPVAGQFTVMVVNDAVLQLSGYRPPDLVETVYAQQPISMRFVDNRKDVAIAPLTSPLAKGWGYGGGDSSGAASTRLRENFQALAYYGGSVLADENGEAEVSFDLPDDLTTWRVMAIATDGKLNFGKGDATFITTQPLITNPLLPQFLRQGDRAQIGLSITNTTDKSGNLDIVGKLGEQLSAESADNLNQQIKAPSGTDAYRLTVVANQAGESDVEFRTSLDETVDAFKVPLTVKALEITEQVVESGTTTDSVTIPLRVGEEVDADVGGLQVALASNLLSNLQMPAEQTLGEDYFPSLETLASRIAIASQLKTLSQKYTQSITEIDLNAVVTTALDQMRDLQQPDGGFTAWPSSRLSGKESDPFVTPYAVSALSQAKAAGFTINDALLASSKTYLDNLLSDPGQYSYCQNADCKNRVRLETLNAFAELGDVRNQYVSWLYDQRESFSLTDQIKLARHLSRLSDWQSEAETMTSQIQELIYETGRGATLNVQNPWSRRWSWLNSQTAAQAQTLQLFIAQDSRPELLSRLVQSLLAERREGTWAGTYNNAQALTALVSYAQRLPNPPNFETTVQVGSQTVSTNAFEGYEAASADVTIPMSDLPQGDSELQLQKAGSGELHYVSAYRYRPAGNPSGRLNGLRVTREVRSAGQSEVLHRFGLQPLDAPVTFPVGQVFDVGIEIIADRPVDHVIITDSLPAGLEAVDTTFQTATGAVQAQQDSWEIDYQKIYRDRILAYADHLDVGVYKLHYLVRSVTPGTFGWPGASASLQYASEEFGRTTAATLEIN